jgi:hypothetical protein
VKAVALLVGAVVFVTAIVAAIWALFMFGFNTVVHDIFHGPEIGFWQAGACVVLLGFVGRLIHGSKATP